MQHILCFSVQNKIETFDVCSITFAKRDFESELQVLHLCMMVDVLIVLAPFLSFAKGKGDRGGGGVG